MRRFLVLSLGVVLAFACGDDAIVGPAPEAVSVTVLTRNLYLGADLDPILAATDPTQIPLLVAQAWGSVLATSFPERAGALAREIATTRPHVVGLQEVALYRRQSPGDAVVGGTVLATQVVLDFLQVLRDSLAARGLVYNVAAQQQASDVELPMFVGFGAGGQPVFDDIRFTDRDVVLARSDVGTSAAAGAVYTASLPVSVAGVNLAILRGWTSVRATVSGVTFRFVNTHLETQVAPPVQQAQAAELLTLLSAETAPVVLLGDFNSSADGSDTPTYGTIAAAGYDDLWSLARPGQAGFTCCQRSDLRNAASTLASRIDIIFVSRSAGLVGAAQADVLGEEAGDRTSSGLWPSDHGGVVATFRLPSAVLLARR